MQSVFSRFHLLLGFFLFFCAAVGRAIGRELQFYQRRGQGSLRCGNSRRYG